MNQSLRKKLRSELIGEIRDACFALHNYTCQLCLVLRPKYLELEEIAGRLRGNEGTDALRPDNCVPLCRDCHTVVDTWGRKQRMGGETESSKRVIQYLTRKTSAVRATSVYGTRGDHPSKRINPYYGDRVTLIGMTIEKLRSGMSAQQYLLRVAANRIGQEDDATMKVVAWWDAYIDAALDKVKKEE